MPAPNRLDIMLPFIRRDLRGMADNIIYQKLPHMDAYMITFEPKIRSSIMVTGPFVYANALSETARLIVDEIIRTVQLNRATSLDVDLPIKEDIQIDFNMGEEHTNSSL